MITVNLRPDLKRKRAGGPFRGARRRARPGQQDQRSLLLVAVLSWVGVVGWLGLRLPGHHRAS